MPEVARAEKAREPDKEQQGEATADFQVSSLAIAARAQKMAQMIY